MVYVTGSRGIIYYLEMVGSTSFHSCVWKKTAIELDYREEENISTCHSFSKELDFSKNINNCLVIHLADYIIFFFLF